MRSLSEDDQELVEDEETAEDFWRVLTQKYQERLMSHARQYLKSYVNFEVTGSIDNAWSQLQTIGRRISAIVPELSVLSKPQHRVHVLLGSLLPAYQALVDTINGQPTLAPDQILARLYEKESALGTGPESAMAARQALRKFQSQLTCYLCDGSHGVQSCTYFDMARDMVHAEKKKDLDKKQREQREQSRKAADTSFKNKVDES